MRKAIIYAALLFLLGAMLFGNVVGLEYFFDTDPGAGNGIPVSLGTRIDANLMIPTAALEPGFHRFCLRALDSSGRWGLPLRSVFFVPFPNGLSPQSNIAGGEYFFDTDPGAGNGFPLSLPGRMDFDELISTASLGPGFHRLCVRARDNNGIWGIPQRKAFFVAPLQEPAPPYKTITHLEHWVDTDPGFGNGTIVPITPGSTVNLSLPVDPGTSQPGNHILYLRLRSDEGVWGFPVSFPFTYGVPPNVAATLANGMIVITWDSLYMVDDFRVYSAASPDGPYSLDLSGTFGQDSWSAPLSGVRKFFRVTSLLDETSGQDKTSD